MSSIPSGLGGPTLTPFDEDEEIASQSQSYVVGNTSNEAASLALSPTVSPSTVMFDIIRNELLRYHFRQRRRQFVQTRNIR
jgi:hypothetical protein